MAFGLILLSFLLSFCYRFVSRKFSPFVGHTYTWSSQKGWRSISSCIRTSGSYSTRRAPLANLTRASGSAWQQRKVCFARCGASAGHSSATPNRSKLTHTFIYIHMYTYIYIYTCMYIYIYVYVILSVIVFSSLSFYSEWTVPGTKRQPAILNLIDRGFLISSCWDTPAWQLHSEQRFLGANLWKIWREQEWFILNQQKAGGHAIQARCLCFRERKPITANFGCA